MDFVTQVQRPGENKEVVQTSSSSSVEEPRGFFCCFGRTKKKKQDKPKSVSSHSGVAKLPPSLPTANLGNRDSFGVNSPRKNTMSMPHPQSSLAELLPPQRDNKKGQKCLILDLDETLVHSSFQKVGRFDFQVDVEIENNIYTVYVAKRPGVDEFMKAMGEIYEIVIFTASLAKYADPVIDLLDIHKVVDWRLFREHCTFRKGSYVKDMGRMGRPINSLMIMDNSPHSYAFNPENAIPCESWFDDDSDRELLGFIPILQEVSKCDDVIVELEARKLNGYSAIAGLNQDSTTTTTSDYYTSSYYTESGTDSGPSREADSTGTVSKTGETTSGSGEESDSSGSSLSSGSGTGTGTGTGTDTGTGTGTPTGTSTGSESTGTGTGTTSTNSSR